MAQMKENMHGRRGGRGIRPWLLIPKLLAVAVYFGSLVSGSVLWFTRGEAPPPLETLSFLFRFVIVAAMLVAIAMGVALTILHWPHLAKMRWWRVKVASAVIAIPTGHFYLSSRFGLLRAAMDSGEPVERLVRQIDFGLIAAIGVSIWIIFLGRHKPILGQNWAKTFAKTALIALMMICGGCQWWFIRPDAPVQNPLRPSDFSLSFYVEGEGPYGDPLRRTAMFVLNTDRRLYAASGYRVPRGFRPRLTRVVSNAEYEAIVALIYRRHLIAEPTSPLAQVHARGDESASVLYHVDLTGWGKINRYVTTPEESPPSVDLLARLILAGGGRVTMEPKEKP